MKKQGAHLDLGSDILGGQHGGVRRRLIAVSLDLHTTGDLADGFTARDVGHVHEGVVERGVDVGNAEHLLTGLQVLRAVVHLGADNDWGNSLIGLNSSSLSLLALMRESDQEDKSRNR